MGRHAVVAAGAGLLGVALLTAVPAGVAQADDHCGGLLEPPCPPTTTEPPPPTTDPPPPSTAPPPTTAPTTAPPPTDTTPPSSDPETTTTESSDDDAQTTEEAESGSDGEELEGEVASANGNTLETTRNLLVPGDGTRGGDESAQAEGDGDGGGSSSSGEDRTIYMIIAGLAAVAILVALLTWRYWLLTRPGLDLDDDEGGGYDDGGGPPAYPEGPAGRGGMPDDRVTMANATGWAPPAPAAPPGPPGPPATAPGTAMAPALDDPYGGDSYSADPYATAPHSPFDDEGPLGVDPATASTALPAHHMAGATDPQATFGLQMPGPVEGAAGPRTALGDALGGVAAAGPDRRSARGRDRVSAEPGVPAPPGDRRRRRDRAGLEPDDGGRVRRSAASGRGRPDGDPRRAAGAPDQGGLGGGPAGVMPGRRRRRGSGDDVARPEEPAPRRGRGARSGRGARAEEGRQSKPPKERRRRDTGSRNDPFGWDAVTDASAFGLEQQERSERGGRGQGPTIGDTDGWGRSTRRR